MVEILISDGELLDKLSILQIKKERILDEEKLLQIKKEYFILLRASEEVFNLDKINLLYEELLSVNNNLWDIKIRIRELENSKRFEGEFIELSRKFFLKNEKRFYIKNEISKLTDSEIKDY